MSIMPFFNKFTKPKANRGSEKSLLSISELTQVFSQTFKKSFPTVDFIVSNNNMIEFATLNEDVSLSLDNAFKEYLMNPSSLDMILDKYMHSAKELLFAEKSIGTIDISRIIPVIRPMEFLENTNRKRTTGGGPVYEKYSEQLIIIYGEDRQTDIRYLISDDLKSCSLQVGSLRDLAIGNLDNLLTSIVRHGGDGFYALKAGGDYEASIILLTDIFDKERLPVKGEFVIAIPNRDMLLITGSNEREGIRKVIEIAAESYANGSYQVSPYLYKWNGSFFEQFIA